MPRQCATVDELPEDEQDLTGLRFGLWTVTELAYVKDGKYDKWHATCQCGTAKEVDGNNLRNGRTTSCGCSRRR